MRWVRQFGMDAPADALHLLSLGFDDADRIRTCLSITGPQRIDPRPWLITCTDVGADFVRGEVQLLGTWDARGTIQDGGAPRTYISSQ